MQHSKESRSKEGNLFRQSYFFVPKYKERLSPREPLFYPVYSGICKSYFTLTQYFLAANAKLGHTEQSAEEVDDSVPERGEEVSRTVEMLILGKLAWGLDYFLVGELVALGLATSCTGLGRFGGCIGEAMSESRTIGSTA